MPFVDPVDKHAGILFLTFNQDRTCVAIATQLGVRIFSCDMHKILYTEDMGAVSSVEMLFCTNLLAFVGAGERPELTPRKLTIFNTNGRKTIKEMNLPTAILAVKINRKRLAVLLERKVWVYELENLVKLRTLDTPPNPKGVCALSTRDDICYLALPSSGTAGTVRVYDLMVDGGNVLCEIAAHKTPLRVIAMNDDSTLIATASEKGTLINVYDLPSARKLYTLRRGTTPAIIHSLSFAPDSVQPPLLAASGSHGTVHIFKLENSSKTTVGIAASAAAGLLSAVTRYPVKDLVDPARSMISVSLPNLCVPSLCTIAPSEVPLVDGEQDGTNGGRSLPSDNDKVKLLVATMDGIFYEYSMSGLGGSNPQIVRTGEWRLLGSRSVR